MFKEYFWHTFKYNLSLKKERYLMNVYISIGSFFLVIINHYFRVDNMVTMFGFLFALMGAIAVLIPCEFIPSNIRFGGKYRTSNSYLYYYSVIKSPWLIMAVVGIETLLDFLCLHTILYYFPPDSLKELLIIASIFLMIIYLIRVFSLLGGITLLKGKRDLRVFLQEKNISSKIEVIMIVLAAFLFIQCPERYFSYFSITIPEYLVTSFIILFASGFFIITPFKFAQKYETDPSPIPPLRRKKSLAIIALAFFITVYVSDPLFLFKRKGHEYFSDIEDGDIVKIQKAMDKNPTILQTRDFHGASALEIAIENRKWEMAGWLLKNGADINEKINSRGFGHLHYAAEKCDFKMADFLIENNININLVDKMGRTALFYALEKRCLELVYYFYEKGANRELLDKENLNYVKYALQNNEQLVKDYDFLKKIGMVKD